MRTTALLSFLSLWTEMAAVHAGETETQCESPHQVASVAQAVTDACQDAGSSSSSGLPEHCTADCAAVFLPWFSGGQGTCFAALHLDEQTEQTFSAFASVCETENSAVDMTGAVFVRPSDSANSTLICFDATCGAAPILEQRGAIVVEGCEAGAPLGAVCRLGCAAGFEISAAEDGHCTLAEVGSLAVYSGQSVTCSPETEANGQMSESYCRMAATEAMLDCCELEGVEGVVCAAGVPPTTCVVECAEIWEPLVEDCEQHLQDFQQLTAECAEVADSFLARAPSSLTVVGLQCISDANGEYQVSGTIGGKPHWVLNDSFGHALYHLFAVDEPFEAWVIGISLRSNSAKIESYEDEPPWGSHVWRENCGGAGGMTDQLLTVMPSFSDHDCHEAIQLMSAELSDFCFDPSDQSADFEVTMAAEQAPMSCEYDCAHLWYPYSEECADFLQRQHPYLASFTELCFATHRGMEVISADGILDAGGNDDHTFRARQGLVYSIEEVPGDGLQRTDLAIQAPYSHHVLADRIDVSKQGAGVHRIEWDAPETKSGMDIAVTALEGGGSYHLQAVIMGTAERLAKEAIIGRESLLQIEQHWFDVAEFRYEGMHMRADGTSFLLKFSAGAGLTYQVLAVLRAGSAAAHLRLAIFPPEAIGSASSTGAASESNCQLPPAAQDLQSKDVTEMTFGTWGSPAHGQTWGEQHRCDDLTRVGPPESDPPGCGGQYRYFPGQSFPSNHTWDWTAPFTANYVLQVTANCDVPFYDDPTQPSCTVSADGIECDDDRVTQCAAAIGLTIRVVDRSVHVKHTFDVPVTQEVLNSIELQQRMADMFALQQQPAIVFPLSITPLDCELAENAARPGCQQTAAPGHGGGHRRRRLQTQIGADTDHACPQSSFDTRDTAMRTSCGFQSSDAADPLLQGSCPSLECARLLLPLLDDCAEHITEFARHIGPEAAFYEALGRSEMFADCEEMEQAAAQFASVQVEFRAPTLDVANQMILEHEQMVSEMFLPISQEARGQQLCFGNPDTSVGDGTRCGGRRQLGGEGLNAEVCVEKDEKIRRLEAELARSRAETEAAVQRGMEKDQVIERNRAEIWEKDQIIEQQKKRMVKQATEIAFHQRLHRLRQTAVSAYNDSDSTRRNQTAVGRRTQASGASDSSLLRSARVGADRVIKACAVHPCELSDGVCQNGGTCAETASEGGGAVPFECQCVGNFGGERCETNLCAVIDCGDGECVGGACECSDGWTGNRCQTAPASGTFSGAENCVHGYCASDGLCVCDYGFAGVACEEVCDLSCVFAAQCVPTSTGLSLVGTWATRADRTALAVCMSEDSAVAVGGAPAVESSNFSPRYNNYETSSTIIIRTGRLTLDCNKVDTSRCLMLDRLELILGFAAPDAPKVYLHRLRFEGLRAYVGGSILIKGDGSLFALDCAFENNRAERPLIPDSGEPPPNYRRGWGGAIMVESGNIMLSGCIFMSNIAQYGGAVGGGGETHVSVIVIDSTFTSNSAATGLTRYGHSGFGGALGIESGSLGVVTQLDVRDSTFASNSAEKVDPNQGYGDAISVGGGVAGVTFSLSNSSFSSNGDTAIYWTLHDPERYDDTAAVTVQPIDRVTCDRGGGCR